MCCCCKLVSQRERNLSQYDAVVTNSAGNVVGYTFYKTDLCQHFVMTQKHNSVTEIAQSLKATEKLMICLPFRQNTGM